MSELPFVAESEAPAPWSRARWLALVLVMVALQVGLMFWVGDAKPAPPRLATTAPMLRFAGRTAREELALTDPTLFALPHRQSFSGDGWLRAPRQQFEPFTWSEQPDWMELPIEQLGAEFKNYVASKAFDSPASPPLPPPALTAPEVARTDTLPAASSLRLAGGLAQRPLRFAPALRSWPSAEPLTNTVVQVLVDAGGAPVSLTLLSGCGLKAADQYALVQARTARFAPSRAPTSGELNWGEMIFDWHTTVPVTNAPAAAND